VKNKKFKFIKRHNVFKPFLNELKDKLRTTMLLQK